MLIAQPGKGVGKYCGGIIGYPRQPICRRCRAQPHSARASTWEGSSKLPFSPDGRTHISDSFYDGARVSFVGRPFPAAESDEHFARLAGMGTQRFIRFLVTWEAVEHEGPGIYDNAYLDYLVKRSSKAPRAMAFRCSSTPTRMSGAAGRAAMEPLFGDPRSLRLRATQLSRLQEAALLHQEMGEQYPVMQWFSNHARLALAPRCSTPLFRRATISRSGIAVEGTPCPKLSCKRHLSIAAMREIALRAGKIP